MYLKAPTSNHALVIPTPENRDFEHSGVSQISYIGFLSEA